MKNKKNIGFLFLLLLASSLLFAFSPVSVNAAGDTGGLVPCGSGSEVTDRCTLCHLITGIKGIIDWGRNILVIIALTAVVAGGIMYAVSAGNQKLMEAGKGVMLQALIGVVIVLTAWLIVNTAMWLLATKGDLGVGATSWDSFTCDTTTTGTTPPSTPPPVTPTPPVTPPPNEITNRNLLTAGDVGVNNSNACLAGQTTGCTTIGGLKSTTIDGVTGLKADCGSACNVVVTAGSEGGHSNNGAYSHANGYKVDLRKNNNLDNYIRNNYTRTGVRSDGSVLYSDGKGNTYADEPRKSNQPAHWDVCYQCG